MITKESFLTEFNGHVNRYSKYLVLNTTIDAVVDVLNAIDTNMCVGSGEAIDGHVSFEICKESPMLIYKITKKLQTIGYADTSWDETYTVCAKNGEDFDDYTADWEPDMHYLREDDFEEDEEPIWDAFVIITDKSTGAIFYTGGGAVDSEVEQYYAEMIKKHSK